MSVRTLRHLFEPERLVWIGPVGTPPPWAALAEANLWKAGFAGPIYAVRSTGLAPAAARIDGLEVLGAVPFLGIVCLPQQEPVQLLEQLFEAGCRAMVIIGGGAVPGTLTGEQTQAMRA